MPHPSTAPPASLPLPTWDAGQQRLGEAIALFRSEASASGYVVEEVRLRLPVPDVDVMPRVVIAQQPSSTPPPYPSAKHHCTLARTGGSNRDRPGMLEHPKHTPSPQRCHPNVSTAPQDVSPVVKDGPVVTATPQMPASGFKRTVSGSVIVRAPLAAVQSVTAPPPSSIPATQKVRRAGVQNEETGDVMLKEESVTEDVDVTSQKDNGHFWKTVIGRNKAVAILKAAESMHKMRQGVLKAHQFKSPRITEQDDDDEDNHEEVPVALTHEHDDDKNEDEDAVMQSEESDSENISPGRNMLLRRKEDDEVEDEAHEMKYKDSSTHGSPPTVNGASKGEKTIQYNGHDIPESHVQLLLSSVATISAREREGDKNSSRGTDHCPKDSQEDKKTTEQSRDSEVKTRPDRSTGGRSNKIGRSRRDSGDRGRTSSALRPFKCHKCPSSFDRDGHLKVHILAVHEKKRPFVCQVCDASFGHSSSLLRHVRTVHQASPAVGSGRVGQVLKNTLMGVANGTENMSQKTEQGWEDVEGNGEKHFKCSGCGLAFSRVALLNRHVANKHPVQSRCSTASDINTEDLP